MAEPVKRAGPLFATGLNTAAAFGVADGIFTNTTGFHQVQTRPFHRT